MTNTLDNQNTPDEIDEKQCLLPDHHISWVGDCYACNRCGIKFVPKALITAARITELKRLLSVRHMVIESIDLNCVKDRIKELQATLTNDKIGGEL